MVFKRIEYNASVATFIYDEPAAHNCNQIAYSKLRIWSSRRKSNVIKTPNHLDNYL